MAYEVSKKISKSLADIRKTYITTKDYSNVNDAINKSMEKLSLSDVNNNTLNYAEIIKQNLTKNLDTSSFSKDITSDILNSPELLSRFSRYGNAEEVIYNIPQCARALKVLVSGIISPDNITKASLNILSNEGTVDGPDVMECLSNLAIINKELKIEDMLDNIVMETMKYGDKFLELCSYKSKEVPITQSMYLEEMELYEAGMISKKPRRIANKNYKVGYQKVISEKTNEFGKYPTRTISSTLKLTIVEDAASDNIFGEFDTPKKTNILTEKPSSTKKEKENLYESIEELRIIHHDPRQVIKLQTNRYKVNLGYLVLPDIPNGTSVTGGFQIPNVATTGTNPIIAGLESNSFMGIDAIYKDLVKLIKRHINNDDIKFNKKEMKEIITRLVKDMEEVAEHDNNNSHELKIRYVPPERMEHFYINERVHYPYGEGIFEKTMHAAKELIAIKSAITVRRISDSVDKRVIYIESTMPRNSRNMITALREALRKRKFSIGSLSNISTIPTMMTNFEDYILTQKNGKRSVEFDTIASTTQIGNITDELKFFRDELVSSLDVPPAFIGIEENINSKSTLAHESSLFAETILSYQKIFNRHLFRLFNRIHKLLYEKQIPDTINISLPPPKMLFIGNESEHLETVARLIELSDALGISKDTLRKRYSPFDYDAEKDIKVKDILDKRGEQTPKKDSDDDYGMGGGYGLPPGPPMGNVY